MAALTCLILCLVGLATSVHGYFVHVDAHATECFFDRVSSGMKMGLTFEVVEGGFLDIDVKVMFQLMHTHHLLKKKNPAFCRSLVQMRG